MFWHFALLFMQMWTTMATSVIMSSRSCWKTSAIACQATGFGTSSRNLTATMTTGSASMSFCRYVNLSAESQLVPSVQNFTYARPGFILSPASKDLALLNEQMCAFALTLRAPRQSWKTRTLKECGSEVAKVVLRSCVGFQLYPESIYSQFLLQEWHFESEPSSRTSYFTFQVQPVFWCLGQFVTVASHHSPMSRAHGWNDNNWGFGKFGVHYPQALSKAAQGCMLLISCTQQVSAGPIAVQTALEIVDTYLLLNVGIGV